MAEERESAADPLGFAVEGRFRRVAVDVEGLVATSGSRRSRPRRRRRRAFRRPRCVRPPSRRRRSSRCRWRATASWCRSSARGRRRRAAGRSGRRGRRRVLPSNQRPRRPPLLMQCPAVMTTLSLRRADRGARAAPVAEDAEGEEDRAVDAELGGGRVGRPVRSRRRRSRAAPRSGAACRDARAARPTAPAARRGSARAASPPASGRRPELARLAGRGRLDPDAAACRLRRAGRVATRTKIVASAHAATTR